MTSEGASDDCSRVVDLLVDYLEDKLPPGTRAALDRHLEACASCHEQLRTYRATVSLLRGLCDEDLPVELRERVAAFLTLQTGKQH